MKKQTSAQILKKLTAFAIPLILSGMLQQLFNWVDALIVGNVIGETALAAVGATASVYNLFVTLIVGFTSGLSVLAAQQFGQGKETENHELLCSYSVLFGGIFAVCAVLGMVFMEPILLRMQTPAALLPNAKDYLQIVFVGIPFLAIYNVYSAVLRGMGNSRLPFFAVLVSSVTNAVLDLVFVALCGWGIAGAAAATAIAQAAMTLFVIGYTAVRYPQFRRFRRGSGTLLQTGAKYGAPPAIQSSVSSVGGVFLQRFMNGFGEQTVAAITTTYRVDLILLLPIINLSTAISTLVAQETGAENPEQAKQIFRIGTALMAVLSLLLTVFVVAAGGHMIAIFGLTPESVQIGRDFFRAIAPFYVVYGLAISVKGYLEGVSDLLFSGITGICALVVRLACSYLFAGVFDNMVVAYAEAFSWIFMLLVFLIRYGIKQRPKS